MVREAKKVFLEVKEPFSSEKGSLPPEALERSVNTEGEAVKSKKGRLKKFVLRENFGRHFATIANFFDEMSKKSQTPFIKLILTEKLGVQAPSFLLFKV